MTTHKPKLIEVALPLEAINKAAAREKSIRHGHPSTLHLWWARRPLAATRAVIWASLVDDPSGDDSLTLEDQETERQRLFGILERLVIWENSNDPDVLAEAKAEIDRCFPDGPPPILDPFGGGGAIPLEAQRLGLKALSGDLNPVAVLIQKAMIEIPPRFAGQPPVHPGIDVGLTTWDRAQGLAADIEAYGQWMRDEAERRIGHHYPDATGPNGEKLTPIAWIWARTVQSPDPTWPGHVPLASTWVLRKKPKKPIVWVEPIVDAEAKGITYHIRHGGSPTDRTINRGKGICIATGAAITNEYIKAEALAGRLQNQLVAVVAMGDHGRVYCAPTGLDRDGAKIEPEGWRPEGLMSTHPQYMATPRYGIREWWQLFLPRQLQALTTFSELLCDVRTVVERDGAAAGLDPEDGRLRDGGCGTSAYADAVVTYLAMNVDRCAARWTHLAVWHNTGEKLEHIFRLNAFQMTWVTQMATLSRNPLVIGWGRSGGYQSALSGFPRTGHPRSINGMRGRGSRRRLGA